MQTIVSEPTNRINEIRNIARRNCCSFCRQTGHNIKRCNDIRFEQFYYLCERVQFSYGIEAVGIDSFNNWLCAFALTNEENRHLVRSFGVRYTNSTIRMPLFSIINKIVNFIYSYNHMFNTIVDVDFISLTLNNFTDNNNSNHSAKSNVKIQMKDHSNIDLEENKNKDLCIECSICYEENIPEKKCIKLNCNHKFCKDCIINTLKTCNYNKSLSCALCRTIVTTMEITDELIRSELEWHL
jgi:hypothetical protein